MGLGSFEVMPIASAQISRFGAGLGAVTSIFGGFYAPRGGVLRRPG